MRCKRNHRVLFAIGRISQASPDIFFGDVGIIIADFVPTHPGGDPSKHITHRNAEPPHTRLASSFARFHGNDLPVVHS